MIIFLEEFPIRGSGSFLNTFLTFQCFRNVDFPICECVCSEKLVLFQWCIIDVLPSILQGVGVGMCIFRNLTNHTFISFCSSFLDVVSKIVDLMQQQAHRRKVTNIDLFQDRITLVNFLEVKNTLFLSLQMPLLVVLVKPGADCLWKLCLWKQHKAKG